MIRARVLLAALGGAVACTVGDYLHATHDVLSYTHPVLGPLAWWVPLLFYGASVAAITSAAQAYQAAGGVAEVPSARRVAGDALGFMAAYYSTSFLWREPTALLLVLIAFWLARVLGREPGWVLGLSLVAAVVGTGFEAGWSALGFFAYRQPDFIGVPRWLPGIYLHVAPLAAHLAVALRTESRSPPEAVA